MTWQQIPVAWHISSRSSSGSGNCVEAGPVLDGSGRYAVRDSKNRNGGTIIVTHTAWQSFVDSL